MNMPGTSIDIFERDQPHGHALRDAPVIEPPRRSIRASGTQWSYFEAGQGEPVLLLHGYPQAADVWLPYIGPLSRSHKVIAVDLPGWGQSERGPHLVPDYESDLMRLHGLVQAFGLADSGFNLVAHDYGGFLGLGHTLRHPAQVRRLALINSRSHGVFVPRLYRAWGVLAMLARSRITRPLVQSLPAGTVIRRSLDLHGQLKGVSPALAKRWFDDLDSAQGRAWHTTFMRHYEREPRAFLQEGLERISCPVSVIWGDRDPYLPRSTPQELAGRIPGCRLEWIPGAGHFSLDQRPEEVLAAIFRLLGREAGGEGPGAREARAGAGCPRPSGEGPQ